MTCLPSDIPFENQQPPVDDAERENWTDLATRRLDPEDTPFTAW